MKLCLLLGIAGDDRSYSLSLYNLKAYALADEAIRSQWTIQVSQWPLLNCRESWQQMIDVVLEVRPDVVGVSCYLWNLDAFRFITAEIKKIHPKIQIVWGGPEMAWDWAQAGKFDDLAVDYIVSGEGEETFRQLLLALMSPPFALDYISGLSWRHGHHFKGNEKRAPFGSLASIPSPYLSGVVESELMSQKNLQANIETQRGCNLRCSYCIYHKDMDRISYAPLERTLAEVAWCLRNGCRDVRFVDANFGSNFDHAKALMRGLIEMNAECRLMFELIPGFIDGELADLFAEFSGLHDWNDLELGIGVQTANLDVLRIVRRGIKIEKFEATLRLLVERQIQCKVDLILGLPGETEESWNRTLEWICRALRGSQRYFLCCHILRGLPATELLEISQKYGQVFTDRDKPHELYESPTLPRQAMLRILRRTAVVYRIMNAHRWRNTRIVDVFHEAADQMGQYLHVIDALVKRWMHELGPSSLFQDPDFHEAEGWWMNRAWIEIPEDELAVHLLNLREGLENKIAS